MINLPIAFIAAVAVITTPPIYHIEDLGTLGGELANGLAINELGEVCGQADYVGWLTQPFVWRPAEGMIALGSFIGPDGSGRAARTSPFNRSPSTLPTRRRSPSTGCARVVASVITSPSIEPASGTLRAPQERSPSSS